MTSTPARLLFFAIAAVAGWIVVSTYAGRLFLACVAIATWRLMMHYEWAERRGRPPLMPFARAAAALAGEVARPAC